jgi:hypothetical protein
VPRPRRHPLPVHVFVGEDPPAELAAAADRGECIVAYGPRLEPSPRLSRALGRLVDWAIAQEDAEAERLESEPTLDPAGRR